MYVNIDSNGYEDRIQPGSFEKPLSVVVDSESITLEIEGGDSCKLPSNYPVKSAPVECLAIGDAFAKTFMAEYRAVNRPEFARMCYGAGIVFCIGKKLIRLPNVKDETVVHIQESTGQLVIERVEKTPFGCPSAAILQTSQLKSGSSVASRYIFPSEPILIESFCTLVSDRLHQAVNLPGTGACYGDVPNIYDCVSIDGKRHGFVFAPYGRFEVCMKPRPAKWEIDRYVSVDPLWYDDGNEPYQVFIGREPANFPSLPLNVNSEITRIQIKNVVKASTRGR